MQSDNQLRQPLSGSKKIYVRGTIHPDVVVPMREIELTNATALSVYDTSGAYTNPEVAIDITQGLVDIRSNWIATRNDTENYVGRQLSPKDNGYLDLTKTAQNHADGLQRQPKRAKADKNV